MMIVKPINPPACLDGQLNGRLLDSILSSVPGIQGSPTVRLVDPAMRAWKAMSGTALQVGIVLATTGFADSYRSYSWQRALFTSRYIPELTSYGCKRWDSDGNGVSELWCKADPDYATAAVPGQSNHGWGLAVDIANVQSRLPWLEANALSFGWSWELIPEEPWHLHYFAGDAIPAAVLAYEGDSDMGAFVLSGFTGQPTSTEGAYHIADGSPDGYHVAPREPTWNQTCWPNAPRLSPGNPVPTKYDYFGVLRALFGPPRPSGGSVPVGPVDLTDAAVAKVAEATADEIAADPERDGAGT